MNRRSQTSLITPEGAVFNGARLVVQLQTAGIVKTAVFGEEITGNAAGTGIDVYAAVVIAGLITADVISDDSSSV